jgi:putative chitobiose transport system permease protein
MNMISAVLTKIKTQYEERKRVRLARSTWGNIFVFAFLIFIGVFMALPLFYAIVQSFKPINEIFIYPPRFFVKQPTLSNYTLAFQLAQNLNIPFSRYAFNSLFISIVGTTVYILVASLAAYPLAKAKFPGLFIITQLVIWTLLFRTEVTVIPQYIVIAKLGLINSYGAILLPALAGTFGVFLMKQFMVVAIPDSILEAARIDGASEYRIFWKICMPCVKPAWLTLIIFTFQSMWNATGSQYIYNESLKMLPTVLTQISAGGIARTGASSAVVVMLMIPPIIVFLISQSSVMETMAQSGIK